jgi:transposase InsO family protein
VTGHPLSRVAATLGVGRATAYRATVGRPRRYVRADDPLVLAQIRAILRARGSYGYRRVTVLLRRTFGRRYNRKRVQRLMQLAGLTVPRRHRLRPRRPHRGQVLRPASDERWCSDLFTIACWNGDGVQVAFALDCHDRECLAHVAAPRALTSRDVQTLVAAAVQHRFGTRRAPVPCEWLTDNGSVYTALPTVLAVEAAGLLPCTTPVASPESNGAAEAFVQTLRRDYLDGADLRDAATVLRALPGWLADYNTLAPHSGLGYRAPLEYRRARQEVPG